MKLQSCLLANNSLNQQEIKAVISSMRPEIIGTFGKEIEREVTGLLERLSGMSEVIEAN